MFFLQKVPVLINCIKYPQVFSANFIDGGFLPCFAALTSLILPMKDLNKPLTKTKEELEPKAKTILKDHSQMAVIFFNIRHK